jgi:hypothetical protein
MVVSVPDEQALESEVARFVMGGYSVVNRTPAAVTLVKRKQFNIAIAVLGFLFCVIGLVVYAIVYASEKDKYVEIRVQRTQAATFSADGRWWWDGAKWVDTELVVPLGMERSPDGRAWFDGVRWRPVPAAEAPRQLAPPRPDQGG